MADRSSRRSYGTGSLSDGYLGSLDLDEQRTIVKITVDNEGYLIADAAFHEAVGPSFWERG